MFTFFAQYETLSNRLFMHCFSFLIMKKDILFTATKLLAVRNHSFGELKTKLARKFPNRQADIQEVLDYFTGSGVINDQLFAQQYVEYIQSTSPKGAFRLRQELKKKQIAETIIRSVLTDCEQDQETVAILLARRKLASLPDKLERQKKKEKIFRFLLSKGFPADLALKVTETILREPN